MVHTMENVREENTKKEKVVSLEEFRKKKDRERTIKMLHLPPNATDDDIENAWQEWWKKEVSFD